MAIVWQRKVAGSHYEVRAAGQSRRLYTDGVFHSQYNPSQPLAGGAWDLLLLPAFFAPAGTLRRVLVLGVGGGAVVHLLHRHAGPVALVGVELNPVHLFVAKRYFDIKQTGVQLHQADAVSWLARYRGPAFDLIIDDLYGEVNGEPVRAINASGRWMERLLAHLTPQGILAINFISPQELCASGYYSSRRVSRRVRAAFRLTHPAIENAIGVFMRRPAASGTLRAYLRAVPALGRALAANKLGYRIRRLDAQ